MSHLQSNPLMSFPLAQRPVIFLTPPKKKQLIDFVPDILKSTRTTATLAGILTLGKGGTIVKALKVFGVTGLAGGILEASPIAQKFTKEKLLDPTKAGKFLGGVIEDPGQLVPTKDKPFKEKVKDALIGGGIIGGITAATIGGVTIAKKVLEKKPKLPKIPKISKSLVSGFPTLPTGVQQPQPLGVVKKPVEKVIPVAEIPTQKPTTIKNIFKPSIDIKISKRKRFINQQINIK